MVDPELLTYEPISESAMASAQEAFDSGLRDRLRTRSIGTDEVVTLDFIGCATLDGEEWTLLRTSQGDTWFCGERLQGAGLDRTAFEFGGAVGGDRWMQADGTWSK